MRPRLQAAESKAIEEDVLKGAPTTFTADGKAFKDEKAGADADFPLGLPAVLQSSEATVAAAVGAALLIAGAVSSSFGGMGIPTSAPDEAIREEGNLMNKTRKGSKLRRFKSEIMNENEIERKAN